jgi:hypothetical protein
LAWATSMAVPHSPSPLAPTATMTEGRTAVFCTYCFSTPLLAVMHRPLGLWSALRRCRVARNRCHQSAGTTSDVSSNSTVLILIIVGGNAALCTLAMLVVLVARRRQRRGSEDDTADDSYRNIPLQETRGEDDCEHAGEYHNRSAMTMQASTTTAETQGDSDHDDRGDYHNRQRHQDSD